MLAIPPGTVAFGTQLPIQTQTTLLAGPWESDATPADLMAIARAADRSGYLYAAVCDHVAIPRDKAEAMSLWWQDTFTTLGWLAAGTEQVALLTHVYVLAYRHPLVAAKAFATLDHLSGGRAIVGIGVGHVEAEFDVLGVPFAERGRITDEKLPQLAEALEHTWVGDLGALPRPTQSPRPPIWIGGSGAPAVRRAAHWDGWLPQGPATSEAIATISRIREQEGTAERPFAVGHVVPGWIHVGRPDHDVRASSIVGSAEQVADAVRATMPDGVNQVQVRFDAPNAKAYADQVEAFGTEVAPLLQP
jgi:alkanesulfonate monooxygenase SsuD/methylene tetrahydromethanopterin reductase-like flavin-dependent oxidoreductase (luciferase family)